MIRDPGPIHNLGYSVTSRDLPTMKDEERGDAPNSSFVSRALNNHPVLRFVSTSAASIGTAFVLSRITKQGGLKLAKTMQDQASVNPTGVSSRLVNAIPKIRKNLDELSGVSRTIDGIDPDQLDPYSRLVFETSEGKLSTGIVKHTDRGYYFTAGELRQAGRGTEYEPAGVWGFREQAQSRMVSLARRLPYELPAMYIGQKAVIDPIFGGRDDSKVKWYNPVDVLTDFVKESTISLVTMMAPMEVGGAAIGNARTSLSNFRYSMGDAARSTGVSDFKTAASHKFVSLADVLSEVGHDLADLTQKALKVSAQTSGAVKAATTEYNKQRVDLPAVLSRTRNIKARERYAEQTQTSKLKRAGRAARDLAFGTESSGNFGYVDLLPGLRGISSAIRQGVNQYKKVGYGYDVMTKAIDFDAGLDRSKMNSQELMGIIKDLQGRYSGRMSNVANKIARTVGGPIGSSDFYGSEFFKAIEQTEYKKVLYRTLMDRTNTSVNDPFSKTLTKFINDIDINRSATEASRKVTIGETKIILGGEDAFDQIIKRFTGTVSKDAGEIFGQTVTTDVLERSIQESTRIFKSSEFQKTLRNKAQKGWKAVVDEGFVKVGSQVLKTKKADFESFLDLENLTAAQKDFLVRRSAQRMGINTRDAEGKNLSAKVLGQKIGKVGLNAEDYGQLRSFLVREKQISSGVLSSGFNILGLRPVTLDEATERGIFDNLDPEAKNIVSQISTAMAKADPTVSGAGTSVVRDVYLTKSGNIIDFSGVKQSIRNVGNFLANDLKIPVLGFNPAQMFAKESFNEMSGRAPFQIVQGRISQPFLQGSDPGADFYLFYSGGKSKGKVLAFNREDITGKYQSKEVEGFYRPLARNSSQMLTRVARTAASEKGAPDLNQLNFEEGKFRSRTFAAMARFGVTPQHELKFRQALDINYDQPNSIFGFISRFMGRQTDPNNPRFFARILSGQEVKTKKGIAKLNIQQADDGSVSSINVINTQTGDEMISQGDLLSSFEQFRRQTLGYAYGKRVIKSLEDAGIGTFGKTRLSEIDNVQDLASFARNVLSRLDSDAAALRSAGIETATLQQMGSRINKVLEESQLVSASQIRATSPNILTRQDVLENEVFRYLVQRQELLGIASNPTAKGATFIKINEVLSQMSKEIPAGQLAEARAAAFGTLLNLNSFRANRSFLNELQVQKAALKNAAEDLMAAPDIAQPFINGSISRVNEVARTGLLKQLLYPKTSTAPFRISDLAADPLGSATGPGADVLLVPTFGTVFAKNPMGALGSVLGINTYNNIAGYSSMSAAVSHGVERLNKYFGTVGMQLDVNQYNSPLELFAYGMVGKRVLPAYAAGIGFMTVDRTVGGYVNEKDERGERVYSPFLVSSAAKAVGNMHALGAGLIPGGMSYEEKKEQLFEGEVPIRQGRFWPLGNTPFMGGKIMYYRPSIYRKIETGAMFTSDSFGTPIERALYYTDISPLRPFDPYRFERKHYQDRPYPVTGEYFTGPFGPLNPVLNATVGKVLKPQIMMHEQAVSQGLSAYAPAGQSGAYDASAYLNQSYGSQQQPGAGQMAFIASGRQGTIRQATMASTGISSGFATPMQVQSNQQLASASAPLNTAKMSTMQNIGTMNSMYTQMAYGAPKVSGIMPPRIVGAGVPLSAGSSQMQGQEFMYRSQEALGIYGFAGGALRESFGYGQSDFQPQRSVLQSASKAYGTSRQFWDHNLGGLGDVPLLGGRQFGSIEFSEITRRFIPKERTNIDYINPIQNLMGQQYPFLPGPEYYIDFTRGDPFTKVQEGELRLPGVAYERLNRLNSDETGRYGVIDQYKILGDVAPYSTQYRALDRKINSLVEDPAEKIKVQEIRERVASIQQKETFSEYRYAGMTAEEAGTNPLAHNIGRVTEYLAHRDTFINRKLINKQTAVEDWERSNVYGATFPEWQRPYESFIEPMINKAADRNPIAASATLATAGLFFGRTAPGKLVASTVGAVTGLGVSTGANIQEAITGERFIPLERKKELALEEYSDILSYVKNTRLANMAEMAGDAGAAFQFKSAAKRTMYGAPIYEMGTGRYGTDVESLSLAIPKRKREHFKAMINAPENERGRILSTAGRLERRIYQAAWGMPVEERPNLEEYFSDRELPSQDWEGWHANSNMDAVKIKIGQHMGLEMSQMGYYPQQIREANLVNPSYPNFNFASNSNSDVAYRLRSLMSGMGISGSIIPVANPFGSQNIDINAGVR